MTVDKIESVGERHHREYLKQLVQRSELDAQVGVAEDQHPTELVVQRETTTRSERRNRIRAY
jgi:hypothetical protein